MERTALKERRNLLPCLCEAVQEVMVFRLYGRIRLFILTIKIIKDRNRQLGDVVESPLLEVRQVSARNDVRIVCSVFKPCSSFDDLNILLSLGILLGSEVLTI